LTDSYVIKDTVHLKKLVVQFFKGTVAGLQNLRRNMKHLSGQEVT